MKTKKIIAALLAVLMLVLTAFTGCGASDEAKTVDSITNVDEETVLQVTSDMTRKQLYKLFGDTYGQQATGQNGFLATYIIAGKYIYSVSVFNDDSSDTALGYDGEAILNSLKNGKKLTTQRAMTVSAEKDLNAKKAKDGFKVTVDYSGKYTAYMNGYEVSVKGEPVDQKKKLTGKKVLSIDVLNPLNDSSKKADTADGEAGTVAENRLLGLLEIRNDADEVVYVEIYTLGGESFICRVRQ
ncbi:MAG: hypothetical protein MJ177_05260 [Clostridia bacterium]|nr:hypothetical protein [Clostridia bacterium]